MKLLVKLKHQVPGITIGASGARQPVNISFKDKQSTGQQEN